MPFTLPLIWSDPEVDLPADIEAVFHGALLALSCIVDDRAYIEDDGTVQELYDNIVVRFGIADLARVSRKYFKDDKPGLHIQGWVDKRGRVNPRKVASFVGKGTSHASELQLSLPFGDDE